MSLKNELPIGFEYQGETIRSFELNRIGGFLERIIHNDTLRSERPASWTASVLSGLLKTLGNQSVSFDFEESGGKNIPDVVNQIPLPDAGLILVAGHILTFGSILKKQKTHCPRCRGDAGINIVDIDLSTLPVSRSTEVIKTLKVKLETGWQRVLDSSKAGQTELGWEDKVFDVFEFGLPTIGDQLRNQGSFSMSRITDFQVKLVNDRLERVECSKDGFVMPQNYFEAHKAGNLFFADKGGLWANDRMLIRDALNNLPQIDLNPEVVCGECQVPYKAPVSASSFFPLVS